MIENQTMIAFLPSDGSWCKQPLPHMTLVYAGKTEDRPDSDFNELSKDAITAARITGSFSLPVMGVEELGEDDEAVDVLTFYPSPQLLVARNLVKHWNASSFTNYKPHATIGPAGSAAETQYNYNMRDRYDDISPRRHDGLPLSLYFNKICVTWNEQKLIFDLSSDRPY